ncbi:MAG: hypothetical protein PHQ12_06730 [Chthoniobacteraceae bacterium]|nr:hypothetical protein [Chthoniobacteraceae bacterium]
MLFEEFQHLARLSVVDALDPDEQALFDAGRLAFGRDAELFLKECRKLNAVFALSLSPCAPDPRTKARLFARIRRETREGGFVRFPCQEEAPGLEAFSLGSVDRR